MQSVRLSKEKRIDSDVISNELGDKSFNDLKSKPFILLTIHRRENHGDRVDHICQVIKTSCQQIDTRILYPVHPNPNVNMRLLKSLPSIDNIHLVSPISYQGIIWAMEKCKFIVSDSGGLQEEATSFNQCVLILRELTKRPEVVGYGWGSLIGTDSDKVLKAKHFADGVFNKNDASSCNPFGNGYALETIFDVMMNYQKT